MFPTYGSFREKSRADDFNLSLITGDTTSAIASEYSFYLSLENRAGLNLLSPPKTITIKEGEGVGVTINPDSIGVGEDVFWVVISISTTGNSSDAVRVAAWQARENDQVTFRSLPYRINFTVDEHFLTARAVADFGSLPVNNILDGAIALVADTNIYYRYDRSAVNSSEGYLSYGTIVEGASNWVRYYGTFSTYISDTQISGCDRPLVEIDRALPIPPKVNFNSVPIVIWLNNGRISDGGSPIVNGCYNLNLTIGGEDYSTVFGDRVSYVLKGYYDRLLNTIDTSIDTVGEQKLWNQTSPIKLPVDLPRGYAAVYELVLTFADDELMGLLPQARSQIALNIFTVSSNQGKLSEAANYQGDLVMGDGDKLLIVPGETRLGGQATIKVPGSSKGYLINTQQVQPITGLVANTGNRLAAIAGSLNGFITIREERDPLAYSEKIRAYISTESGYSNFRKISSTTTTTNTGIKVTVTHPVKDGHGVVRSDYPDPFLAGNDKGRFTPTKGYVFIEHDSDSFDVIDGLYQSEELEITQSETQEFFLPFSNFRGNRLDSFPDEPSSDFSLFEPIEVTVEASGEGEFNGSVTAYFAYYYDENNLKATKIRHDLPGTIPTATLTIGEIISELGQLVEHKDNLNNPHEVTIEQIKAAKQVDLETTNSNLEVTNTNVGTNSGAIATNTTEINNNRSAIALNTTARESAGSASYKDFGTDVGNLIELEDVNGTPGLPAVDGSRLTGIDSLLEVTFVAGDFTAEVTTPAKNYLIDTSTARGLVTLPENVADKSRIAFSDRAQHFGTNNAIITPATGDTVNGEAEFALDFDGESVTLVYDATNTNWVVINGIQSTSTGSGDMLKSVYDTDGDGVVDTASAIAGIENAGNLKFYGTNDAGIAGFYDYLVGEAVKQALENLTGIDRLSGNAIANFKAIANPPGDGYAPIYDLDSDTIQWQFVNRGIGAGALLIPTSQSLFETEDSALSTYAPDVGSATYEEIKIYTTANVPDNQIVNEKLQINTPNTGVVLDLGISNTVIRTDWTFNSGDKCAIILRYDSDGNMNLLELSATQVAFKSIVDDIETTVLTTGFNFTNGTSYKIEVQCLGVQYKVLIDDVVAIAEVLSNEFLTATKFGLGRF